MIGRHLNIYNQEIENLPIYTNKIKSSIFQFFLDSPEKIFYTIPDKSILNKLKKNLIKKSIYCVIHGNYTINLCHSNSSFKGKKSISNLISELNASELIGNNCLGVIIHVGKNVKSNNMSDEEATKNFINNVNYVLSETTNSNLIIETGSSKGTELFNRIEDLKMVYDEVFNKDRLYFCIDTCHIWASGYRIDTKKSAEKFMNHFDNTISLKKVKCIHFNNSYDLCGSKKDNHHDLDAGKINISGLSEIAKIAVNNNIPLIMETPLVSINPKTKKLITFEYELKLIKSMLK